MIHPSDDAVSQETDQGSVDGRVRLAQDERQLCRFDKRHPAEGVEQLSVGNTHMLISPES